MKRMGEPIVWVMPPVMTDGYPSFEWSWARWQKTKRLIPRATTVAGGSSGSASFDLIRNECKDPSWQGFDGVSNEVVVGSYVMVTTGETLSEDGSVAYPSVDRVVFFGRITSMPRERVGGYDMTGTVEASEIGACLLDTARVSGLSQLDGTGSRYGKILSTPPTANLAGSGGAIIGNAVTGFVPGSGRSIYVFARQLEDCGTAAEKLWTPWRLLTHMAEFCKIPGAPRVVIRCEDGSGLDSNGAYQFSGLTAGTLAAYMDATTAPEVYDLDGLTWGAALELLAGPGVGLGWTLEVQQVGAEYVWAIVVYSRAGIGASAAYGGPPKSSLRGWNWIADDETTESIEITDRPPLDRVVVRGAPIVWGVSLSPLDNNLDKAWTDAQETAYEAATPSEREAPKHRDVFTLFRLNRQVAGNAITRATNPGAGDTAIPLTPLVQWDGTAATVQLNSPVDQYLPALRLLSWVPWDKGRDPATGNQTGDAAGSAAPDYSKPLVYAYDSTKDPKWVDLLSRARDAVHTPASESPSVECDDRAPAIRISYSRAHMLGLDTFTSDNDGGSAPVYDWRKLVVTVGLQSDQRVEVIRKRKINGAEIADQQVVNTLTVQDDGLQCWVMAAGSVVGVASDHATPTRVASNKLIRNDWMAAQRYCDQLAAWAFRPQRSASIVVRLNNDTAQTASYSLRVGWCLQAVKDGTEKLENINACVQSVATDWQRGTATIQTEISPQPSRRKSGSSSSPSSGGSASAELGGTVAQITQRTADAVSAVRAAVARIPIIPAMAGGGSAAPHRVLEIIGGQTVSGIDCIKYAASLSLTQSYDPNTDTVLPDGLGRAWLWTDGVRGGRVLVRHQFIPWPRPVCQGEALRVAGTVSIPWDSGTEQGSVSAYLFDYGG